MAFYRYYCEQNGREIEVAHPMTGRLKTWGEVCACAGCAVGTTPPEAPVVRLISAPLAVRWRLRGLDADAPSTKLDV